MTPAADRHRIVPKWRQKRCLYDEGADEAAKLLTNERVEIEAEISVEDNQPIESIGQEDITVSAAFEE